MKRFKSLAIENSSDLIFGTALYPITTRRGLIVGAGMVYPELNFTLPPMQVNDETFDLIKNMYHDIIDEACRRAIDLNCEGFVVEFETVLEMTLNPQYAIELSAIINEVLDRYEKSDGLKTALRITPNDLREMKRPPALRSGIFLDKMLETFEGCAREGAELLSIESTGGKELHDTALLNCDIAGVIFALGILACRDMDFLWEKICNIASAQNTIAGADTACGFGNTAMVLAEKKMIPRLFAAVVRAATAVRTLVAYENGAAGPGKDCGYENIYLKAITGVPISMEGKAAACAHFSPLGNIAAAACDLWSNESVQNIKLLSGYAPIVSIEQLIYDCRLMNEATNSGHALWYRDLLVVSDVYHDPQALVLSPNNAIRIAKVITNHPTRYHACKAAAREAVEIIAEAHASGNVKIHQRELPYLDILATTLDSLPESEESFIEQMLATTDNDKWIASEYGFEI